MGDVRYWRLRTVEEAKEDVPSMSPVPVNFLCCLLGQATHRTLHPALEKCFYYKKRQDTCNFQTVRK